jgi:hypothetical protein
MVVEKPRARLSLCAACAKLRRSRLQRRLLLAPSSEASRLCAVPVRRRTRNADASVEV